MKGEPGMPSVCAPIVLQHVKTRFSIALFLALSAVGTFPVVAWTGEKLPMPASGQTFVAAGFGFQDEEASFITVKTYDAQSGAILSADTYELDIKDDGPPSSHPRTRIFAGGVGVGAGSLSEFTLRVYDASNGRFLWEGRLNLKAGDHPDVATHPVVTRLHPRAAVTRIAASTKATGEPYFVLRAIHPETGQLMWSDQFSTDEARVRIERIGRSAVGVTGTAPSDIDFRIKMPDSAGRRLLWEDKVIPAEEGEPSVPERSDETAGGTPRGARAVTPSSAVPAAAPSNVIETDRKITTAERESPPPRFAFS
jgi:hypothetical protein